MPDQVINIILEAGAPEFHFLEFLVRRKVDFLLDAINRIIEPMVFVKHGAEMIVAAFEAADHLAMLRKLTEYGMMKVHMV